MGQIVVGYDGSGCSNAALDRALEVAAGLGDRVIVVFGYAPPGIWGGEIAEHEDAIAEIGNRVMQEASRRTAGSGVEVETQMVAQRGAEALLEVAAERGARMIVVGSYGDSALKGAILGSTPYRLLHQTDVPVLVVPARP